MFEPRSLEGLEHRRLYLTVQHVSEYYEQNTPNGFWPDFNAAVAYAFSGALRRCVASSRTALLRQMMRLRFRRTAGCENRSDYDA